MPYPERIVCLAAETPDILHQLGALDRVVGISAYTKRPEEALSIPKISGFRHGSIARILDVRPDLVILTSDVQKDLAAGLADAGVHTLHLHPHRLDDLFDIVSMLGNLVGQADAAAQLNDRLRGQVEAIRAQAERLPWHPRVYFEEWMDPLICGTGWVSDLIELAGGRDVFRDRSIAGRKAERRVVTHQDVLAADPDLVFASWCGKPFEGASFLAREGYDRLTAARTNGVHELDSLILQFGPMLLDSAEAILRILQAYTERHPGRSVIGREETL